MSCDRYENYISELIDNELHHEEEIGLYMHLGECTLCRNFFRSCMKMKETIQSIPYDEELPADVGQKTGWMKSFVRIPLPAAAIFVILFISGIIGTSLHFFNDRESIEPERYQIIYISEYPEIEVRLMSGRE